MFCYPVTNMIHNLCKKKNFSVSLKQTNFFLLNEIQISQEIIKIPKYELYFNPIITTTDAHLGNIDDSNFESCDIINGPQYICVTRMNISIKKSFAEYFYDINIVKNAKYLNNVINGFKHLLNTVNLLDQYHLVNLDFHPRNLIIVDSDIIITNFKYFFCTKTIDEERINKLFTNYNTNNIFLPLEAHVLCFLKYNNCSSLSTTNIEDIVTDCGSRLKSLNIFSDKFIKCYTNSSIKILQQFINKPIDSIIKNIIAKSNTWNMYSLSILFLILIRDIFKTELGIPKNKFIRCFSQQLVINIHFDSTYRKTAVQNISLFNDILYSINSLDFRQLIQLI